MTAPKANATPAKIQTSQPHVPFNNKNVSATTSAIRCTLGRPTGSQAIETLQHGPRHHETIRTKDAKPHAATRSRRPQVARQTPGPADPSHARSTSRPRDRDTSPATARADQSQPPRETEITHSTPSASRTLHRASIDGGEVSLMGFIPPVFRVRLAEDKSPFELREPPSAYSVVTTVPYRR